MWCKLLGHKYKPYEYTWAEFLSGKNNQYNRDGIYRLKHVYCSRCGVIKYVLRENDRVVYVNA